MALTNSEMTVVEEMVYARATDIKRPVWMPPHRFRMAQKEARRRIGAKREESVPDGQKIYYHAHRRVRAIVSPTANAIHESDGDVPICSLGDHYANNNIAREQLGYGPVTCGKCAGTQ